MWYTYHLCDSGTPDIPFYIGKGAKDRIDQHERNAKNGVQSAVCNRIRDIWASGRQVVKRKVLETHVEQRALVEEAYQIGIWQRKTALVNHTQPNIIFLLPRRSVDH